MTTIEKTMETIEYSVIPYYFKYNGDKVIYFKVLKVHSEARMHYYPYFYDETKMWWMDTIDYVTEIEHIYRISSSAKSLSAARHKASSFIRKHLIDDELIEYICDKI